MYGLQPLPKGGGFLFKKLLNLKFPKSKLRVSFVNDVNTHIMKKAIIYITLLAAMTAIVAFVVVKDKHKTSTFLPLKERSAKLAQAADWPKTKSQAEDLLAKILANPKDEKARLQLASLYIQEARVTGDHLYYDRAAMQLVNSVLNMDSTKFEALCFKSMLYLSEHHFADGRPQ